MKWLFNILFRDQNLLPLKVRTFIFLIIIISSPLIIFSNSDTLHKLAACGIVLGVLGAGVLYWETIATDPELESIVNEIAHPGNSGKLSLGEIAWVITFSLMMVPMLFLGADIIIYQHMHGKIENEPHTALRVGLLLVGCALPASGLYGWIKLIRVLCNRWLKTLRVSQEDARKAVIKRILRLIGFASLSWAGILQFPATLF
jgi:hypothetical protein